ncbi:MAG: 16S rRNA (uracil(1498)-N(3))-methyltransferase [Deltaproteobacteria bacterium]|nr:16S rRNA (uracil(1498)-N(3))-methyltransferase [Deltaproteobacteria bacterium]
MTYFLSGQSLRQGQDAVLEGAEARHITSARRMRPGERFALQDPEGNRFEAELLDGGRNPVVRVGAPIPPPPLPPLNLVLLQGAVKDKAAETIIQKAAELGAAEVVLFPGRHSTLAHKELSHPGYTERLTRIAWEACKQCDRQFPPVITLTSGLSAALAHSPPADLNWVCHPKQAVPARVALNQTTGPSSARVLVGPEGGLAPDEVEEALRAGFMAVEMGALVLRADTATVAAASLVLFGTQTERR